MMSSSKVVKSPTLVAVVPTLVLTPLVLIRTCNRSGNAGKSIVRVQKLRTRPSCRLIVGVSNQLLRVDRPVPLLKLGMQECVEQNSALPPPPPPPPPASVVTVVVTVWVSVCVTARTLVMVRAAISK